jgi:hypothetical protein
MDHLTLTSTQRVTPMASATAQVAPVARTKRLVLVNPEFDLLLACCADATAQARTERIQSLFSGEVDWNFLRQIAQQHGVIPQVYQQLSQTVSYRDIHLLQDLRQAYEANARQTLWLTRELIHVVAHLQNRGITVLPYKVPVLAQILYGNVASRQYSDLDLLLRAEDVPRARSVLADLGYEPKLRLSNREERAYLKSGYEYTFDSPHGRNLLEVKWNILPRFYSIEFEVESLFARAVEVQVGGASLQTLCPEDLMLVLCVHAAKHAWVQLSWLCDIARLANHAAIDWRELMYRARQLGVERIVAVTFSLVQRLLGTPPQLISTLIRNDRDVERRAASVIPIITGRTECNPESWSYFRLAMDTRERKRDRVRFLWRLASTPGVAEWSLINLPRPLFALYGLVRVFRLAKRIV